MFKMRREDQEIGIKVRINFLTDISLWNALKLRLAGGKVIKEFIDARLEEARLGKEEKPNVSKSQGQ